MSESSILTARFRITTEAMFVCYMVGATWNCCHLGTCSVYSIQPCNRVQCHFIRSHFCWVHNYAFSYNLPPVFLWNDSDQLRATAVRRGWNGYRNESQHSQLTMEKKYFPPILPGLEPEVFGSRVRLSTTELPRSLTNRYYYDYYHYYYKLYT